MNSLIFKGIHCCGPTEKSTLIPFRESPTGPDRWSYLTPDQSTCADSGPLTEAEHAGLQKAAAILDVAVSDLPYFRGWPYDMSDAAIVTTEPHGSSVNVCGGSQDPEEATRLHPRDLCWASSTDADVLATGLSEVGLFSAEGYHADTANDRWISGNTIWELPETVHASSVLQATSSSATSISTQFDAAVDLGWAANEAADPAWNAGRGNPAESAARSATNVIADAISDRTNHFASLSGPYGGISSDQPGLAIADYLVATQCTDFEVDLCLSNSGSTSPRSLISLNESLEMRPSSLDSIPLQQHLLRFDQGAQYPLQGRDSNKGSMMSASSERYPTSKVGNSRKRRLSTPPSRKSIAGTIITFHADPTNRSTGRQKQRLRGPYTDMEKRKETAKVRKLGACWGCQFYQKRCSLPNGGLCDNCAEVATRVPPRFPCVRYKITDSSLFYKGERPNGRWSKRWPSWMVVEIALDSWASPEIRTIVITQDIFGGRTLKIRCRQFIPEDGDSLARTWRKDGRLVCYPRAPYAIYNMKETGEQISRFIATDIGAFIKHYITELKDQLLSDNYAMAYAMVFEPEDYPTNENGRRLVEDCFKYCVAAQMECQPERIVGEETLGMHPQDFDPGVASYGTNSITPLMSAQFELITTTRLLQPLRVDILERLKHMIAANDLRSWIYVYLSLFLLLHSCSVVTKAQFEQARKQGLKTNYLCDKHVARLHLSASNMLYHYHYRYKGRLPLSKGWSSPGNFASAALNTKQADFLQNLTATIKRRNFQTIRNIPESEYRNECYFVSQLYDKKWRVGAT